MHGYTHTHDAKEADVGLALPPRRTRPWPLTRSPARWGWSPVQHVGNMDVLGLVVRLATASAAPVVRHHALLTLQDLLAVYPLNVVPLLETGGVRALVAAVARQVTEGGADPHVAGLLPLLLYIAVLLSNHSHDVLLVWTPRP